MQCNIQTQELEDFQVAKVQIDTTIMSQINAWIYFSLNGNVFDVHVAEYVDDIDRSRKQIGANVHGNSHKEVVTTPPSGDDDEVNGHVGSTN